MKRRIFLISILALAVLGACSKEPDAPVFDNPFDPAGTAPGSGYALEVHAEGDSLVMSWNNVEGLVSYQVYWSDSGSDLADMVEIFPGEVVTPDPGDERVEVSHRAFTAEATNYYRVVGRASVVLGSQTTTEPVQASLPVALEVRALVFPVGGITSTPTRWINLSVLTGTADTIEIANSADFSGSSRIGLSPGVATEIPWALPLTTENRKFLQVHFRPRSAVSVGAADSFQIQARFVPQFAAERGTRLSLSGQVMVDSLLVFGIVPVDGQSLVKVERFRGSPSDDVPVLVEDVTPATIDDPVTVHWDVLTEAPADGFVRATLQSDFGFEEEADVLLVVPDAISGAELEIVGGSLTVTRDIRVLVTAANAGYVLLSENPDFAGATWVTFADTLDYQLADVPGSRQLYATFSNPFLTERAVAATQVDLVFPPARARR